MQDRVRDHGRSPRVGVPRGGSLYGVLDVMCEVRIEEIEHTRGSRAFHYSGWEESAARMNRLGHSLHIVNDCEYLRGPARSKLNDPVVTVEHHRASLSNATHQHRVCTVRQAHLRAFSRGCGCGFEPPALQERLEGEEVCDWDEADVEALSVLLELWHLPELFNHGEDLGVNGEAHRDGSITDRRKPGDSRRALFGNPRECVALRSRCEGCLEVRL